jgi:hypothetical protein
MQLKINWKLWVVYVSLTSVLVDEWGGEKDR